MTQETHAHAHPTQPPRYLLQKSNRIRNTHRAAQQDPGYTSKDKPADLEKVESYTQDYEAKYGELYRDRNTTGKLPSELVKWVKLEAAKHRQCQDKVRVQGVQPWPCRDM